jgi:glucose/arabinose dehydrogenase
VFRWWFLSILLLLAPLSVTAQQRPLDLSEINLPPGFEISLYAENVTNARSMALGDDGTLFVGSRRAGNVYALRDHDGDFYAEDVQIIARNWDQPNGVAFYDGDLYVAEITRIRKFEDIEANLDDLPTPEIIYDDFPSERHHNWRYIAFGPDDKLYVPVGSPCDLCLPNQDVYGLLTRMNPDGTEREILARGIRNTVGFDFHPETGDVWFTDNGADWLGDDIPPDELNHIRETGLHFGFPFCHSGQYVDATFGQAGDCETYEAPVQQLGPHVAALGMTFYTGEMFPEVYHNQIFIAERGSAARTERIGYRVSIVLIDPETGTTTYVPFAEGWLDESDQSVSGRLVDVLVMPDGSLLVSDDFANAIYRITYTGDA